MSHVSRLVLSALAALMVGAGLADEVTKPELKEMVMTGKIEKQTVNRKGKDGKDGSYDRFYIVDKDGKKASISKTAVKGTKINLADSADKLVSLKAQVEVKTTKKGNQMTVIKKVLSLEAIQEETAAGKKPLE